MKNKIDKFSHLACIQLENRNAVAYDCRDVVITLRKLKFKRSQSTHTFHYERKKFSNQCGFLKAKGMTKSNHEVLGLWKRSLRLHDVIDFDVIGSLYPKDNQNLFVANRYSSISYIKDKNIATRADVTTLTLAKKRCEWECNKTISSKNFCVFTFVKTSGYRFQIESNSHLSDDNC